MNLFDDHGVEDIKCVSMTQWKNDPNKVIVHGSSEIDDQHSYATIVRVPKMGCQNCKKLRESESSEDNLFKNYDLCIKCNLTVHTKYRFNESTQKFQPKIHLNAPDYLIMCENSLIHTINVKLDMQQQQRNSGKNFISQKYLVKATCDATKSFCVEAGHDQKNTHDIGEKNINNSESLSSPLFASVASASCVTKPISIVEQILADFSEFDSEYPSSSLSSSSAVPIPATTNVNAIKINNEVTKNGCEDNNTISSGSDDRDQPKNINNYDKFKKTECGESSSRLIKKKSLSSCAAPSSPEMLEAAAKTYEFSEENEKCEKISIFRKRRLADKKYEFSEENTENIIPFNRTRTKISKRSITTLRRASPHPSFLSPCGSPIGNNNNNTRHLMSPPGFRSPSYYTYRSSPTYPFLYSPPPSRHIQARINAGSVSPASGSEDIHKYFSDIMNRMKDNRIESGNESHDESFKLSAVNGKDSPMFSKKIVHHYVEEDDANSVVTCDEDDCISPGFNISLPMEIHGSCYSKMQVVSKMSLNRLKGHPRAIITQNSFDIETFSIHIANLLCKKNDKKYGILFDLAYEIVHVSKNENLN